MALSTKLELKQGQQLVMTPQLQQAIRLLQLSNLEVTAFVEAELERNPLLERDEANDSLERPLEADVAKAGDAEHVNGEMTLDLAKPNVDAAGAFDTDFDNIFPDSPASEILGPFEASGGWASIRSRTNNSFPAEESNIESFVVSERSLKDHLTEQLQLAIVDPVERIIGTHIIDLVDEAGYLQGDCDSLASKLGASEELIGKVLCKLQTFDPVGVFARNLAECLILQLKERNRFDPQIAKLLDHLALLGDHNLGALRRAVGVDAHELAAMIAEIKQLNPKPGLKFGSVQIQPVVPDILVRSASDGSWIIELNSDTLPRVLVNQSYYTRVSRAACSDRDKSYLLECLQTANWLVKSLDQRARTILRVAEEIVRQQDGFLTYGVQHLRPLNLRTVADRISMHESTVSRVTSNKYMATPRGIYELKYFFTSAISAADDATESHSSEAVRHRIRTLIDAETAHGVLSDDKIVERLKHDGIDIARRTVAKYREAMRIPSSVQRRREKQMAERLDRAV
jgi:RNA polymerase sigma-54 factor